MTDHTQLREALEAADALISKVEERIVDVLAERGEVDEKAAFYDIVEMFEVSPEITKLRLAIGQDPTRWGDRSAMGSLNHTG